jgi:hypothetical protein
MSNAQQRPFDHRLTCARRPSNATLEPTLLVLYLYMRRTILHRTHEFEVGSRALPLLSSHAP